MVLLAARVIDRAIELVNPVWGMRRAQARLALEHVRRYDLARVDRLTRGWNAPSTDGSTEILAQLQRARNRARDLHRNNPWIATAGRVLCANLIGTGIVPRWSGPDSRVKAAQELWDAWAGSTQIDADRRHNWVGLQWLAARTMIESGSVLIRRRYRRPDDGLAVPLQLEVIEPDHLDRDKDQELPNGGRILGGIEFDVLGRRRGYYLRRIHPGDQRHSWETVRVDADDILHLYRCDRPKQVDGFPFGAAAMLVARDLSEFNLTELTRAKIAACFSVLITKLDPDSVPTKGTKAPDNQIETIEPGRVDYLEPGENVVLAQPPTVNNFAPFVASQLRAIAVSFGLTYEALTGDLSNTSFSSGRMGWLEMSRNLTNLRQTILLPLLCQPVWDWMVQAADANLSGLKVKWSEPRREMINPKEEAAALQALVAAGFDSRSSVVAQLGREVEQVDAEQAADQAREKSLGLSYARQPNSPNNPNTEKDVDAAEKKPQNKAHDEAEADAA
jgi:lambda family phage portal protein